MEKSVTKRVWDFLYSNKSLIAIISIMLLAAILRYSGYNWDDLYSLHPDERAIAYAGERIDFLKLKLDPEFYAYGTLPIYLAKLFHIITTNLFKGFYGFDSYIIIGRLISATAGTLTVLLVYLTGKKLYNDKIALLGSFLLAVTVLHIQNSHFATVDIILTFFITASLYSMIDIFNGKATTDTYYQTTFFIALALAVKISSAPLVVIFFICHVINLYKNNKVFTIKPYLFFIWCGLVALAVNFLAQPHAYISMDKYLQSVHEQVNLIGHATACYTQQYIGSPYLLYYLKELVLRCMGPPLGILCIVSFITAILITLRHPVKSKHTVLLLWCIPYFITINNFEAKFLRYLLPLIPFFCLFGSYYFIKLLEYLQNSRLQKVLGVTLSFILIGYTLFYSLAFFSIYMKPHTFVVASKWFHTNIPEEAFILSQHWDEGFPLHSRTVSKRNNYKFENLEIYEHFGSETEDEKKAEYLSKYLEKGDYIVAQTKRLYGAVYNVNEKYPVSSRYFDLLFTNRLGFKLIKEFNSYPSILGIEFNDDTADESFGVYDHPKILIFKKVESLSDDKYKEKLLEEENLQLSKDEAVSIHNTEQQNIITYSIIDELFIVVIWIVILELFSIPGFALLFLIFKKFKRSNIFISYITGILAFNYCIWLLTYLNIIKYSSIYIIFLFILSIVLSIYYLNKKKETLLPWLKNNIDTISLSKISFIGCIIIFLIFRSLSPEIFSGEKPMDLGILNNLIRNDSLPPEEIWFGGKTLSYYYFGHFIFATLTKMSFLPDYFTFNLAVASIAGLTFTTSCGVMFLLSKSHYYSLMTGIFTVFLGNLSGIRELIWGDQAHLLADGKNPLNFHLFWATSRVIPHTVNEYPLWSAIFGDLHGHFMAMPVYILILYLGIYMCQSLIKEKFINWTIALYSSFTLGVLSITNTWDIPGSSALLFTFITLGILLSIQSLTKKKTLIHSFKNYLLLLSIGISSFLWFLPYWLNSRSISKFSRGFLNKSEIIKLDDYLVVWGLFLFIFASLFLFEIYRAVEKELSKNNSNEASKTISIIFIISLIVLLPGCLLIPTFEIKIPLNYSDLPGFITIYSTNIFTIILIILGIVTFFLLKETTIKIVCGIIIFGLAITLFTETCFFYDRMNTVFKLYLETWLLFAISSVYVLYYLFQPGYYIFRACKSIYLELIKLLWFAPLFILIALAGFTSITAIIGFSFTDKTGSYKPVLTINGIAYSKYNLPSEYQAIEWIKENIKDKNCILLESHGNGYSQCGRVCMNTGIPIVVGWEHHLTQRGVNREDIKKRSKDVRNIYTCQDANEIYDLLKRYKVNYIFVGNEEIKDYGIRGLQTLKRNPMKFKQIFNNDKVTIFRVL